MKWIPVGVLFSCMALLTAACNKPRKVPGSAEEDLQSVRPSSTAVLSADPEEPAAPPTKRPPKKAAAARQVIEIPGGSFTTGSTPGDRGREPALEASLQKVDLGPYSVDRLPYPNDPGQPPKTDVTRTEAERLCAERGQRLCTELEWERACKGPESDPYPTGASWDPACETHPNACATGFDVLAMGAAMREWTASTIEAEEQGARGLAVLRGGREKAADTDHRCARREGADAGAHGPDIGFRCCGGPANAANIAKPKALPAFRRVQLDTEQVTEMIRSVPQLAPLGTVTFFKEPDDVNRVLARGDAGRAGANLTTSALLWSPDLGEELLVLAGLGENGSSFVAAFHRLPDDRYRLASSFVLKDDKGPIVLGFNGWVKNRLTWTTCWGCLGEEGAVIYRRSRRVVIEQL